ncbi:alpha/beta hydrolase [Streptomyces sp. NPDC049577]|uniref:alpha/beta hydrolase n=1 Tax=Streptomyces sp. NPDC049577 TaxID=3155153 RepID=UPI00341FB3EF
MNSTPNTPQRPARRGRVLGILLLSCVLGIGGLLAILDFRSADGPCDQTPTGIATDDYWLHFKVPAGLMPDHQFDGRPAKLQVHRVRPEYQHGKCEQTPVRAAVLVHGRTLPGSVAFDLQGNSQGGNALSVQAGLARAGIDTFAPSMLGYGRSTRFDHGLDDPDNASLRAYASDGSCPFGEGCDRTHNPVFPLDQQGTVLATNPLRGQRHAHSSNVRFGTTDVWARDIGQVVEDAVDRARPTDGKVTLLGYSLGGQRVARALYPGNTHVPNTGAVIAKVNRVVFLSSIFGGPTEDSQPPGGFVSFPLTVGERKGIDSGWAMPPSSEKDCTGHVVPGSPDQTWKQSMKEDVLGRDWGGTDASHPAGVQRSPTFSGYGWNAAVAGQLTAPTLVVHGLDDKVLPASNSTDIYGALPSSMSNKVLVQVRCASHQLLTEGCSGTRCKPPAHTAAYGQEPDTPWDGPHATLKAALIEWITKGTFNGKASGKFTIDTSGVAH